MESFARWKIKNIKKTFTSCFKKKKVSWRETDRKCSIICYANCKMSHVAGSILPMKSSYLQKTKIGKVTVVLSSLQCRRVHISKVKTTTGWLVGCKHDGRTSRSFFFFKFPNRVYFRIPWSAAGTYIFLLSMASKID